MIAIDAHLLVRYIVLDNDEEAEAAQTLIDGLTAERRGFVSREAVTALVGILEHDYGFARDDIARLLVELTATDHLVVEEADDIARAAAPYRSSALDLADLLMVAAAERVGASPLRTLDTRLAGLDGVVRVPVKSAPAPAPRAAEPEVDEEAAEAVAAERERRQEAESRAQAERSRREAAEAAASDANERREASQARVAELERQVSALQQELKQTQENFKTLTSAAPANGAPTGVEVEVEDAAPADVEGAVRLAKMNFDRLHFLNEAEESARDSLYNQPERVYSTFEALDELAGERAIGSIGRSVEDWLRERGITYSPHESQTTMGMYGGERTYHYGNEMIAMPEHIKFGIGPDPRFHIRIHIYWHEDESRWIIGHVGRHLTNTKTS